MARKIITYKEFEEMQRLAKEYGEFLEGVIGVAMRDMICDNSGEKIAKGEICAAVCLLPSSDDPNYEFQRPREWAREYIVF